MVRLQKYSLSCAQSLLVTSSPFIVILCRLSQLFSNLDNALRDAGPQRNCSKDVNLADTVTGLGCDLPNAPPLIEPAAEKMKLVTQGILAILFCPRPSLAALNSLVGVIQ